jgi:hypothetical protein
MASAEANFPRYSPQPNPPSLPTSIPDPYRTGTSFESIAAARHALVHHTVARQLSYKVHHSDKHRYTVVCRSGTYPFRIRFKIDAVGTAITTIYREHTCPTETHYDWWPANSVKYLEPQNQEVFDNDHTI